MTDDEEVKAMVDASTAIAPILRKLSVGTQIQTLAICFALISDEMTEQRRDEAIGLLVRLVAHGAGVCDGLKEVAE